jgi:alcohol dehydrogenase
VFPGQSCGVCAACARGESFFCRRFKIWGFDSGPLDGGHAEYARVHEAQVVQKPSNLSFEEAAALPLVLVTAWRMLKTRAGLQPGQTVLIWGAAGGLVSNAKKAALVAELGASHVINRREQDVVEEVRRITGKQGVDVVFEHTGQDTWPESVQSLRRGGTLVVCGATSGYLGTTDIRYLWNKQQNFHGSHLGTRAELEEALGFVARGEIRPVIHAVLPLRDVPEGQRLMEKGEVLGKIVYATER